jgi:hypothetical protein
MARGNETIAILWEVRIIAAALLAYSKGAHGEWI